MKKLAMLTACILFITAAAATAANAKNTNDAQLFFDTIKKHCGNAYEGTSDAFGDERLVMHVASCKKNEIRIPFNVGENRSRTWVLTLKKDRITLKHDHRHHDGKPEQGNTMYGGTTTNSGSALMQVFPADQETVDMDLSKAHLPFNVWFMTIDDNSFTYNLRTIGRNRLVNVKFDLSKKILTPPPSWGQED